MPFKIEKTWNKIYCHHFWQNHHWILSLRGLYLWISLRSPHPPLDRCNHCMVPCHMSPCPLVTCPIITCVRTPHCPDPVLHRLSTDHLQRSWQEPKIHQICRRAKWAKDGMMYFCVYLCHIFCSSILSSICTTILHRICSIPAPVVAARLAAIIADHLQSLHPLPSRVLAADEVSGENYPH